MSALIHTHACGFMHGDVKPSNLLLGSEGLLLSDWGIALNLKATSTIIREPRGSLLYMAPEQKDGHPVQASDQYAMAVTGCEIITGKRLEGLEDLYTSYPLIAQVFKKALAPDPSQRFPSMQRFLNAFDKATLAELTPDLEQTVHDSENPDSDGKIESPQLVQNPNQTRPDIQAEQLNFNSPVRSSQLVRGSSLPETPSNPVPKNSNPPPPRSSKWHTWQKSLVVLGVLGVLGLLLYKVVDTPTLSPPVTTLCIATNLPQHGSEKDSGAGIIHAVKLALTQSVFATGYKGYRITQNDMDDTSNRAAPDHEPESPDPTVGVMNIQKLVQPNSRSSCTNPIAIIGPRDSTLAPGEISEATKDHILLLTPSNTAPCLTLPNYSDGKDCTYDGGSRTFGRLPGNDIDQGDIIGNLLLHLAGPTPNIVIVDDEEIYGVQLAQAVTAQLSNLGNANPYADCITSDVHLPCKSTSTATPFLLDQIAALALHIKSEKPTAIFFAGDAAPAASALRKDLESTIPFVVGAAILDEANAFFGGLGSDAENIYAILPTVDPSVFNTSSATLKEKIFYAQYSKQFGGPPQPYSANGYDAANIIIQTIKGMIDTGQPITSANVAQAVLHMGKQFTSVIESFIQFNSFGDNVGPHTYTIYNSEHQANGSWSWKLINETIPTTV